ncbi:histidine ammonia-lyase [Dethiosulfatibacter aminovorans DSM 17477]|uniref:Histidine ammonia-lyase n=1 Tax=Dethiosulfatibacter aminovorans DSM 17477 TaxID=1121476 RepID=A0A1M6G2C4_9FIRM|nr:aromatic amino acid ammonia-lyase [Dethiosulfatibacter aminovorans]SHJ04060.1 histidine ammonia-lyase [Dethiosulfatibacter aminovorans DSM 17477]
MDTIMLNGRGLTFDQVKEVAYNKKPVEITEEAEDTIKKARALIFKLADEGYPVYGLNRGVGWNKDKYVFSEFFQKYNENLINAHCVAVGPDAKIEEVRAMMVIRLNTALCGSTGMAPELLHLYRDFLNNDIVPVIPRRGSIGEADIATLSHIGLAMIGQGDVFYNGERMAASKAIEMAGLKPAELGPKDGLGIVSSNAHGAGLAALAVKEVEELIEISNLAYCLGMEGLNGNIESLDEKVNEARKMKGQMECAAQCREFLSDSYLHEPHKERALQDSLAYRGAFAVNGSVLDSLNYVKENLEIQLNSTDDNPCILVEEGRLSVSTNFEPTTWVVGIEMLNIALSHMSKTACHRTIKLSDPSFTKLTRFLTPSEGDVIAYGTIQKCFTSLDTEIRMLANPSSMDYFSVAGNIEDHANNSPLVVDKLFKILDNLRYIIGMELMHAVQAIDLRKVDAMGTGTRKAYDLIRSEIPFLENDRCLSVDIKKAYDIIKSGRLLEAVK